MHLTDTLLVGFDISSEKENCVLIIGRKNPNESMKIINAFQGEEAKDLYKKLTEVKKNNAEISE